MSRYSIDITLEVEAETGQLAIATARDAGMSLQGRAGVEHAAIDHEPRPLFDSEPFAQIRGQTALD